MCSCQKKISGMKNNLKGYPIDRLAMIGAGAVGAEFAVNSLVNNMTKDKPESFLAKKGVPGALKLALGIAGISMSKNKMVQDAALGAVAAGGLDIARSFLSIPSVAGVYTYEDQVRGYYPNLDDVQIPAAASYAGDGFAG